MAHRYFISEMRENLAFVYGEEARHMAKVMRMQVGEALLLCDQEGWDYQAQITELSEEQVCCTILEKSRNPAEPMQDLVVYMALPKGDKLELIIQKCCELGVRRLVPFVSANCVAQKSKKDDNKRARFQKISNEATKQCGRSIPMEVSATCSFGEMLLDLKTQEKNLLCYEYATAPLAEMGLAQCHSVGLIIGSEGGFTEREVSTIEETGADTISLGRRILRCETAAIVATALVGDRMGL